MRSDEGAAKQRPYDNAVSTTGLVGMLDALASQNFASSPAGIDVPLAAPAFFGHHFSMSEGSRRKPLRLRTYDYTSYGAYFITIVTHDRRHLFGGIERDEMRFTPAGVAVHNAWDALTARFPTIELDTLVVMPNHVHGILWLLEEPQASNQEGAASGAPTTTPPQGRSDLVARPVLGDVMRAFKSTSAIAVNRALARSGDVWQRNYFEKIIRSQPQLDALRRYINENPLRWALDEENDIQARSASD